MCTRAYVCVCVQSCDCTCGGVYASNVKLAQKHTHTHAAFTCGIRIRTFFSDLGVGPVGKARNVRAQSAGVDHPSEHLGIERKPTADVGLVVRVLVSVRMCACIVSLYQVCVCVFVCMCVYVRAFGKSAYMFACVCEYVCAP